MGTTGLVDAFAEALKPNTNLSVRSAEQAGLDLNRLLACPSDRRLSCWTEQVRASTTNTELRHLFVLSARSLTPGQDRIALTWMDLDQAAKILNDGLTLGAQQTEDALFAASLSIGPRTVRAETIEGTLKRIVEQELQSRLRTQGHWQRLSALTIESDCTDCTLIMDGRIIAPLRAGRTRVTNLPAGEHSLQLNRQGKTRLACAREISIPSAKSVELRGCAGSTGPQRASAAALRWAGIAALAGGAVLVGVGAHQAATGPSTVCVTRGPECQGLGFASLGGVNRGGPSWVALGAGVGTAGAGLLGGSYLEAEPPWWLTVLGAALLGGTAYFVTEAVNPGQSL